MGYSSFSNGAVNLEKSTSVLVARGISVRVSVGLREPKCVLLGLVRFRNAM